MGPSIETIQQKTIKTKPLKLPISNGSDVDSCSFGYLFLGPIFEVAHLLFGFFFGSGNPPIPSRVTCIQDCVGLATAAFGFEVLEGKVKPGVWFPVEPQASTNDVILEFGGREGWILSQHPGGGKSWIWFLGTHIDPGFECKRPSFGGFKPLRINRFQGIKLATLKLDGWTDCIPKMRRKNDIPIFCGEKT